MKERAQESAGCVGMIKEVEPIDDEEQYDDDEEYDEEVEFTRRKRKQYIVLGMIVIISVALLLFYFLLVNPSGVMDIVPGDPLENDEKTGIIIKADVVLQGTGKADGDGGLEVKFGSETTYSGKIPITKGIARKELKYSDFVTENGNYEIIISYENKESSIYFNVDWVVVDADIALTNMSKSEVRPLSPGTEPSLNFTVSLKNNIGKDISEVKHLTVDVKLSLGGSSSPFTTDSMDVKPGSNNRVFHTFKYSRSDNITAEVTITNDDVKSVSKYRSFTITSTNYINAPPIAYGELDDDDGIISLSTLGDSGIANFDAAGSFDLDGEIVKYQWEFDDRSDDNLVITTELTVSHQYVSIGTYHVTLTVIDDSNPAEIDDYMEVNSQGEYQGAITVVVKQSPL